MAIYKAKLVSGKTISFEDARDLHQLSNDLTNDGYVLIQQLRTEGYGSGAPITTSMIESSVETIWPVD